MSPSTRVLVVVNGAIASGKSAVARALAGLLEERGRHAAVIDLDEVWHMLDHQAARSDELRHWLLARRAAARLTDEFFDAGIDAVIIEGPFFTREERDAYQRHLQREVKPRFVTLRVTLEESFRRAENDPGRVSTKNRALVAERHAASEALLAPLRATDLVVETDGRTPQEIAGTIAATLA